MAHGSTNLLVRNGLVDDVAVTVTALNVVVSTVLAALW